MSSSQQVLTAEWTCFDECSSLMWQKYHCRQEGSQPPLLKSELFASLSSIINYSSFIASYFSLFLLVNVFVPKCWQCVLELEPWGELPLPALKELSAVNWTVSCYISFSKERGLGFYRWQCCCLSVGLDFLAQEIVESLTKETKHTKPRDKNLYTL